MVVVDALKSKGVLELTTLDAIKNKDNLLEEYELNDIKPEDYQMLKEYFNYRYTGTCENIILDSYIWSIYYNTKYIITDKGLLFVYDNKEEVFSAAPLCKKENIKDCFAQLVNYFNNELGKKLTMYVVDEEAVKELDLPEDKFRVEEDRKYFDYVYDAEKLRTLSGKKYHKKKNHVNQFIKGYEGRFEFKMLTCEDEEEVLKFIRTWKEQRDIQDSYNRVDYEILGIEYVLKNCRFLKFKAAGVYIDGKLEAFTLGSYSPAEKTAYIHVEKANPDIRGLYNYINQQFIIHGFEEAEFVNREDDMGLEGLRKAKMSYNPVKLVPKYNIFQI